MQGETRLWELGRHHFPQVGDECLGPDRDLGSSPLRLLLRWNGTQPLRGLVKQERLGFGKDG